MRLSSIDFCGGNIIIYCTIFHKLHIFNILCINVPFIEAFLFSITKV